jgi:hypothetical protein
MHRRSREEHCSEDVEKPKPIGSTRQAKLLTTSIAKKQQYTKKSIYTDPRNGSPQHGRNSITAYTMEVQRKTRGHIRHN